MRGSALSFCVRPLASNGSRRRARRSLRRGRAAALNYSAHEPIPPQVSNRRDAPVCPLPARRLPRGAIRKARAPIRNPAAASRGRDRVTQRSFPCRIFVSFFRSRPPPPHLHGTRVRWSPVVSPLAPLSACRPDKAPPPPPTLHACSATVRGERGRPPKEKPADCRL